MSKFSQRGVSLYLAVMIMSIILAIVLGITVILVEQLRMIRGMENSVIAFYAADTGIEEVLKVIIHDHDLAPDPKPEPEDSYSGNCGNASYEVLVVSGGEQWPDSTEICDSDVSYCIRSVGSYRGTRRAIEVTHTYAPE